MTSSTWLSEDFFTKEGEEKKSGLLWLPPLGVKDISRKIDWLSKLTLTKAYTSTSKAWSKDLEQIVESEGLELDREPRYRASQIIFKLPKEFKSSMAMVLKNCSWEDPDRMYSRYLEASKDLNPSFIQSPYMWSTKPSQLLKDVQWIKV